MHKRLDCGVVSICFVACNCHPVGSLSTLCNETGYCDCKGNAGGQRCDSCKPTFYNFSSSNPDVCEGTCCIRLD